MDSLIRLFNTNWLSIIYLLAIGLFFIYVIGFLGYRLFLLLWHKN